MDTLRFELMRAVIEAMHFDTPEGESTPGEFMDLINEIDARDPMKKSAEIAVDQVLEILKSHGIRLSKNVYEKKYVDPMELEGDDD